MANCQLPIANWSPPQTIAGPVIAGCRVVIAEWSPATNDWRLPGSNSDSRFLIHSLEALTNWQSAIPLTAPAFARSADLGVVPSRAGH